MPEKGRAFLTATLIMLFLLGTSLFVGTATTKASQRVMSLVDAEIDLPSLSQMKKPTIKKLPRTVSTETSIKTVKW